MASVWLVHRAADGTVLNAERWTAEPGTELGNAGVEIADAVSEFARNITIYIGDTITVEWKAVRK